MIELVSILEGKLEIHHTVHDDPKSKDIHWQSKRISIFDIHLLRRSVLFGSVEIDVTRDLGHDVRSDLAVLLSGAAAKITELVVSIFTLQDVVNS